MMLKLEHLYGTAVAWVATSPKGLAVAEGRVYGGYHFASVGCLDETRAPRDGEVFLASDLQLTAYK
jgi:hypothetical protein